MGAEGADVLFLWAFVFGAGLMPVGLGIIGLSYLSRERFAERAREPLRFFSYAELAPSAKRLWLAGYWLIVGGYVFCMALGFLAETL